MKTITVTIEGTTPLLVHRFTDAAQLSATSGTRASIATDAESPVEQATQALYTDDAGTSGIPQPNLFRCLIDAGKFFKAGRSKITTQKSSLIPACVAIEQPFLPIDSTAGWKVDTRPVRIPSTGGRILRHRPCYDDWWLRFTLTVDETVISVKLLRELVDTDGSRIGLGDFRPDCKGPFGKFKVTQWEERQAEEKAA